MGQGYFARTPTPLVVAIVLTLSACEDPQDCTRLAVTRAGPIVKPPPRSALPQPADFDPNGWGVVGRPFPIRVWAALTACPTDVLRVSSAELVDEAGAAVPVLIGDPFATGDAGVVGISALIEDPPAGRLTLRVAFEPSLGLRTTNLLVAQDGVASASVRVPVPAGVSHCIAGVWPLNASTVACETDGGTVQVSSSDGGVLSFPGLGLVAAEEVLWSVHQGSLERRELDAGVPVLTYTRAEMEEASFPSEHGTDRAIRRTEARQLIQIHPGERDRYSPLFGQSIQGPFAAVSTGLGTFKAWNKGGCTVNCNEFFRGVEPRILWFRADDHSLEAFERESGAPARWRLAYRAPPCEPPTSGFSIAPLWMPTVVPGVDALVTADLERLSISAWPRQSVKGVSRYHVVLAEEDDQWVRVFERVPSK